MKTTTNFSCIAVTPSRNARALGIQEPEEMLYLRDQLTPETIAMLMEYQDALLSVVRFDKGNDGVQYTDIPSMDDSLRHALSVAIKATRATRKNAHGQWALRNKASAA